MQSTVIFRTMNSQEAELVRGILELYGIPVRVDTDGAPWLYPFGETRLVVPSEAEDEAQEILAGHQAPFHPLDAPAR
ncbi:MAG: hypothetical protein ACRD6R_04965 [Candidatus Polarisedimenticolia bacterium]